VRAGTSACGKGRTGLFGEKPLPKHPTPFQEPHTHTTRDFHCRDWGPFAASESCKPTGAPFQLLTDTHSLSGASSSLRLDPRFPEAESPTQHMPDEFIEWYSSVKQLELGASREGPRTSKSLGNYNLTILNSHPTQVLQVVSKQHLIQWCYSGLGSSVPHWGPPLSLGRLKILPLSSKRPCCCQWMTTSISSSCN